VIHIANPKITTLDAKTLKIKLQIQQEFATTAMNIFWKGKYFSMTQPSFLFF